MNEYLDHVYWGNSVLAYLIAAGSILIVLIVVRLIRSKVITLLKRLTAKTDTNFDDILIGGIEKFVIPYIYLLVNYSIISQLYLHPRLERILEVAMIFVSAWYIIRLINYAIHGGVEVYMKQKNEPPERIKQLTGILLVVKAVTWILGIVMVIGNLGYDITTIIAGLGVGGIAVALAAQNILGDLFSYLVIFFDKPFEVGDFIIVGDNSGIVEKIGVKTSHVRSLDGQQLVMPNAEMVKTVIQNYKRLLRRRVILNLGVTYDTPTEKLRQIPDYLKEIISRQENCTFDRSHFKSFGDFSLNFETIYYSESPDFTLYMNVQQAVGLAVKEKFEAENIEFAFPSQTIYLQKQVDDEKEGGNSFLTPKNQ